MDIQSYIVRDVLEMANIIELDNLAEYISSIVQDYNIEVEKIVLDECKNVANQLKNDLANGPNIPVSNAEIKHYKESFAIKKAGTKDSFNGYKLYNKKGQLTHLLEHGHATKNGGRTRAFPHWEQANRKAQNAIISIRKRLEDNK